MEKASVSVGFISIFMATILVTTLVTPSYGYDPLDPSGNITIVWDALQWNSDTYDARVSIYNYQLFRHIDNPGWNLTWTWNGSEVIWSMAGAEATEQGKCPEYNKKGHKPHCCKKNPTIVDFMPGAPYNMQVANCCKGGVLSSLTQNESKNSILSAFQMNVGISASSNWTNYLMPDKFDLGVSGYTCGSPFEVPASRFTNDGGRRWTEAVATWNVICSYSQFRASMVPTCCVSLSAFYNKTIVRCPKCSCGCQGLPGTNCVDPEDKSNLLQMPQNAKVQPLVRCSSHMCPIRVHWHVKVSYREYWRVKITVENLHIQRNYSQWNLVIAHPNLRSITQVFSFNYKPLDQYGPINDSGVFYGIQYYNDMLLQSGDSGVVQTEMLLHKDPETFTFREGWVFPRKISFNGQECVMPSPDDYPRLPNRAPSSSVPTECSALLFFTLLGFIMLLF